jgi:hypothetical protein
MSQFVGAAFATASGLSQADVAVGGKITEGALGTLTGNFLAPITRILEAGANVVVPTALPPVGTVIDAYYRNYLGYEDTRDLLRLHGVNWGGDFDDGLIKWGWNRTIKCGEPQVQPYQAAHYVHCGILSNQNFNDIADHHGLTRQWQKRAMLATVDIPDVPSVFRQFRLGIIPFEEYDKWLNANGLHDVSRRVFARDISAAIPYADVVSMLDRGTLPPLRATANINAGVYQQNDDLQAAALASLPQVSIQDIYTLARFGAADVTELRAAGLLSEYPSGWGSWIAAASESHLISEGTPAAVNGNQVTHGQIAWAAHWKPVDVAQMARFRSQTLAIAAGWTPPVNTELVGVSDVDVMQAMRTTGVLPQWRGNGILDTYTQFGMRELLQIAEHTTYDQAEYLRRGLLDGYSPSDASSFAASLAVRVKDYREPWFRGERNRTGATLASDCVTSLGFQGLQSDLIRDQLSIMGFTGQEIAALEDREVRALAVRDATAIPRADERERQQLPARYAMLLVQQWVHGGGSDPALIGTLAQLGWRYTTITAWMQESRQALLTQKWQRLYAEQQADIRQATVRLRAAAESSYRMGLTDSQALISLLVQSGMPAPAAQLALMTLDSEISAAAVKVEIAALEKRFESGSVNAAQGLQLLQSLGITQSASQRYIAEWQQRLKSNHHITSAGEILTWVSQGLMSDDAALLRLEALGWSGMDAKLALAKAEATLHKSQAASAKASVSNRQRQIAALQKINKEHEASIKANESAIKKAASLSTVKKWTTTKVVGLPWTIEWFQAAGYTPVDAAKYLVEWGFADTVFDYLPGTQDAIKAEQAGSETAATKPKASKSAPPPTQP